MVFWVQLKMTNVKSRSVVSRWAAWAVWRKSNKFNKIQSTACA